MESILASGKNHFALLYLIRSYSFFAPPHRQRIRTKRKHAERWSALVLDVFRKLNFGRRLLHRCRRGPGRSSRLDWLVRHGFVGVSSDRSRQGRPVRIRICRHSQPYPAKVGLAIEQKTDAEILTFGIPAPEETVLKIRGPISFAVFDALAGCTELYETPVKEGVGVGADLRPASTPAHMDPNFHLSSPRSSS